MRARALPLQPGSKSPGAMLLRVSSLFWVMRGSLICRPHSGRMPESDGPLYKYDALRTCAGLPPLGNGAPSRRYLA